jgi:hypothetical protein
VSYARPDEEWAVWLGSILNLLKFDVELDIWSWRVGDDFTVRMNQALESADILIAVLSEAYVDPARYSALEVSAAQVMLVASNKRLVLVSIDETLAPPLLRSRIPIRLSDVNSEKATRLFVDAMLSLSSCDASSIDFGAIDAIPFPSRVADLSESVSRSAGIDSEIHQAAAEAADRLRDITQSDSEPLYIEQAYQEALRLGRTYLVDEPEIVFREANRLRARIDKELTRNRNPEQLRDLHLAMARVYGIMSYTALDLGHGPNAEKLANSSLAHATRSGEIYARAWAFGTQSLIARFNGNSSLSVQHALKGLELPVVGTARCRLLSNAAESHADLGREQSVKKFLSLSEESLDQEAPDSAPTIQDGIFYFPPARVHFYAASSLVQLPGVRSNEEAASQAEQAVNLFENSGPSVWSYNDILVAHVHLARARIKAGHFDGVLAALEPVLLAPMQYRTSWHAHFLMRLDADVAAKKMSDSQDGRAISIAINAYLTESAHLLPQNHPWIRRNSVIQKKS